MNKGNHPSTAMGLVERMHDVYRLFNALLINSTQKAARDDLRTQPGDRPRVPQLFDVGDFEDGEEAAFDRVCRAVSGAGDNQHDVVA